MNDFVLAPKVKTQNVKIGSGVVEDAPQPADGSFLQHKPAWAITQNSSIIWLFDALTHIFIFGSFDFLQS